MNDKPATDNEAKQAEKREAELQRISDYARDTVRNDCDDRDITHCGMTLEQRDHLAATMLVIPDPPDEPTDLPGEPDSDSEAMQSFRASRESIKPVFRDMFVPEKPEDVYRFRVQLDWRCVEEQMAYADRTAGAPRYRNPHYRPWTYLPIGQPLPPKQILCTNHERQYDAHRDIVASGRRNERLLPADPVDPPKMWKDQPEIWNVIRSNKEHLSVTWTVTLNCGHIGVVHAPDADWMPEHGLRFPVSAARLEEMRQEWATLGDDADEFAVDQLAWIEAGWPQPRVTCPVCPRIHYVVAWERVGWLAKPKSKSKPIETKPLPRKILEQKLRKLEDEAAALREELKNRPDQ
jgi:hypothetical protein